MKNELNSIPLLTPQQGGQVDREIQALGFSPQHLMGQAALAIYYGMKEEGFFQQKNSQFVFLCGPGNNGGDGTALAWHLLAENSGVDKSQIKIFAAKSGENSCGEFYRQKCLNFQIDILPLEEFLSWENKGNGPLLIIDALLGTGAQAPLRSPLGEILQKASSFFPATFIALDVPTGLFAENFVGPYPHRIYCLGSIQKSLALNPQLSAQDLLRLLPIGFPSDSVEKIASGGARLWLPTWDPTYFQKKSFFHKYLAGAGAVVGGSGGMEGALMLAMAAFFAAGGGIARGICPLEKSRALFLRQEAGGMYSSLENPYFDPTWELKKTQAVLVGPGLNSSSPKIFAPLKEMLQQKLSSSPHFKLILDAGALVSPDPWWQEFAGERVLLTPHPGELQQMGISYTKLEEGIPKVMAFSQKQKTWVLIKENIQVLCGPGGECFVWNLPNPQLAVAGSGDILGGILLALWSRPENQSLSMPEGVRRALTLQARACRQLTHPTATDLIRGIRSVLN